MTAARRALERTQAPAATSGCRELTDALNLGVAAILGGQRLYELEVGDGRRPEVKLTFPDGSTMTGHPAPTGVSGPLASEVEWGCGEAHYLGGYPPLAGVIVSTFRVKLEGGFTAVFADGSHVECAAARFTGPIAELLRMAGGDPDDRGGQPPAA